MKGESELNTGNTNYIQREYQLNTTEHKLNNTAEYKLNTREYKLNHSREYKFNTREHKLNT